MSLTDASKIRWLLTAAGLLLAFFAGRVSVSSPSQETLQQILREEARRGGELVQLARAETAAAQQQSKEAVKISQQSELRFRALKSLFFEPDAELLTTCRPLYDDELKSAEAMLIRLNEIRQEEKSGEPMSVLDAYRYIVELNKQDEESQKREKLLLGRVAEFTRLAERVVAAENEDSSVEETPKWTVAYLILTGQLEDEKFIDWAEKAAEDDSAPKLREMAMQIVARHKSGEK